MPLVSVIIPCYNSEKFVADTIDSVLKQSFTDWEIIAVNNLSTDDTENILKQYSKLDSRINYYNCDKLGVSAARNLAINKANSKYLALLDSDDIWYSEKLSLELPILELSEKYIASYSSVDYIDENGVLDEKSFSKFFGYTGEVFLQLLMGNFIQNPSPILRTQIVKDLGGFDENLSYGEDWDLFMRLAFKGQFYYHSVCNSIYRKHSAQTTKNHDITAREEQALYLLDKNFEKLDCYLKKFNSLELSLPEKNFKTLDRVKKTNLKHIINNRFKQYFSKLKLEDLNNKGCIKNRALSNLYFRLAKYYKEDHDLYNAKRCIKQALKLEPRRHFEPVSLKILFS
jgi:glycosyltransferase involved in cell wall biosynthesis